MERNENGFSGYNFTRNGGRNQRCPGTGDIWQGENGNINGGMMGNQNGNGSMNGNMNGNGNMIGGVTDNGDSLGGNMSGCAARQLAMVYSPHQCWRMLYSPEKALMRGTLFEELDKPLEDCVNG